MTQRVTLSQARRRKKPLYYRRRGGELELVLCWRKWGADIRIQVITGSYIVSHQTILEVER